MRSAGLSQPASRKRPESPSRVWGMQRIDAQPFRLSASTCPSGPQAPGGAQRVPSHTSSRRAVRVRRV